MPAAVPARKTLRYAGLDDHRAGVSSSSGDRGGAHRDRLRLRHRRTFAVASLSQGCRPSRSQHQRPTHSSLQPELHTSRSDPKRALMAAVTADRTTRCSSSNADAVRQTRVGTSTGRTLLPVAQPGVAQPGAPAGHPGKHQGIRRSTLPEHTTGDTTRQFPEGALFAMQRRLHTGCERHHVAPGPRSAIHPGWSQHPTSVSLAARVHRHVHVRACRCHLCHGRATDAWPMGFGNERSQRRVIHASCASHSPSPGRCRCSPC